MEIEISGLLIFYLTLAILGLALVLLVLPTLIVREQERRRKKKK